ncbi:hypothetical protein LUZ63_020030 [Rhynchospora breviuscula]|uniref:NAD(P)-binding domain-containing protein n=1 Tax=Rhynchospora breviuscula TaxID=2022672 RepID=A0A9P9Z9D5_9POAL|nr:hypothetical protein LUZ63_020030 [Rhynchospora breviuscula]
MTLTLTGSTGHLGRLVLDRLGDRVDRLVVRDASRAPAGFDTRVATYGDRAASVEALRGTDVLLMVSGAESPTRREEHRTFIEAAAEAGVGHVVYTSFLGAAPDAGFTLGRDHFDAEEAVRASGMAWTLLRDNFYTEVLPLFADEDGVVAGPAGQGRLAAVARADVADVAAAVLSDAPAHAGATYALTGPEALTLGEATERMTRLLGREFSYREESVEEAYASRRRWSQEQWQLEAWVSTYTAIADGECAQVTDDVRRVTGHDARTLEDALG